jgi:hypothetical protein
VEDHSGAELLEHVAAQRRPVLDVGELAQHGREVALVDQLPLDLEQRSLGVVDQNQPRRPDARDLAAQLGTDRPARSGDEHGGALEIGGDLVEVDLDLLPAEHVLHLDGTDLAREIEVSGDELVQARQRLHHDPQPLRRLDDASAHVARDGRHRDQHLVGAVLAQHARQLVDRAQHADAHDPRVPLPRVVVDEPDRRVVEHPRPLHLLHDQSAGVARADDDHLLAARHHHQPRPLDHRAREETRARDECEREEQVDRRDRPRQPDAVHRRHEVDGHVGHETRDDDAARGRPHVADRDVAPPAVVEAERDEDDELDRDDDQDRPAEERDVEDRPLVVEAQREREPPRERDDRRVDEHLPEPVP